MKVNQRIKLILLLWTLSASLFAQPQAVDSLMSTIAAPYITNKNIPGVAITIYFNGQDYYYNYGVANTSTNTPVTQDTIFQLASVTKVFISTLLAIEVKAGQMNLSDPAIKYIPQLANTNGVPIAQVKLIDLATHTASFPRNMRQFGVAPGNVNGLLHQLANWQPNMPIGSEYQYSNIGFGFLGVVLHNATHQPIPILLNQYITQPLGMTNTYFSVPQTKSLLNAQGYKPNNTPAPPYRPANLLGGGALHSTAADLLLFMKANLGIKTGSASPQLLAAMQFAQQPYYTVRPNFSMGLGWQRVTQGNAVLITKNGRNQGFNTFIGYSPSKQLGVVVLMNTSKGKAALLGMMILEALSAL